MGQAKSRILACQATVRCRSQDKLGMSWSCIEEGLTHLIGTQLGCLEWLSHHTFFHLKFLYLVETAFKMAMSACWRSSNISLLRFAIVSWFQGFPDRSVGKESGCNAGNYSSIPGSGRECVSYSREELVGEELH